MRKRNYIFGFVFAATFVSAQDLHFSQFNETPALVNPALTGADGPLKIALINKDQWKSVTTAFRTYGATFETRITLSGKADKGRSTVSKQKVFNGINAGLSFFSDKTGDGALTTNKINLSISTFLALNKNNFISVGIQNSYIQRKVNAGNFIFPDQYNGSIYDPSLKSSESFATQSYFYMDAAAGVLWSYDHNQKNFDVANQFRSHIGFSVYHLTKAKDQFLFPGADSYLRYVVHGDLVKSLGKSNLAIAPSFLLQFQGPSTEILIGTLLKHSFKGNSKYTGKNRRNSFGYGLFYRNKDAVVVSAVVELAEQYTVVFGYDVNISGLRSASSYRGGFEVGLKYTRAKPTLYQKK
ncbi:MAG: PorP/SprF family type IX secretion system membrane protein [Sphingobacteriaceae bacterium]|nr:PorP/SprF family type IX secretion system membrane protein [Sphingobacteriaceae bacterium]MBK7817991.1 PorP/SprF family type IX secretion system membrane protein [Sphingobacteriaceae bacterium]